ncbi:esterase/lipase family protein [Piscinibacter sakaiensis]|uniref:esterase/lipase family protein n=1 Tax=Piscinibacter sakaiensis TaxID=1547922 RepID=UPI003AAADC66
MRHPFPLLVLLALLAGCATPDPIFAPDLDRSQLPKPDRTLSIAGLGPCTDNPDRRLQVRTGEPVTLLVHGCFGSSGQFRALAQVLAFQGQQSACFTYDDRAALDDPATELRRAVSQLAEQTGSRQITVIGHSQGALVARKAMTDALAEPPLPKQKTPDWRLVTISGPFSGIDAARTCGKSWLYPLTLGLLPLSCHAITGAKWADITFSSRFINEPGQLSAGVDHLKIDTDERDTCRRQEGGRCVESDFIFSLAEQRNATIDADPRVDRVEVDAGHVEIVGDKLQAPTKLLAILEQKGVLQPVAPERRSAFERMVAAVYGLLPGHRR